MRRGEMRVERRGRLPLLEDVDDERVVDVRDGSIQWPEVRKALDEVGYNGWLTIEGGAGGSLPEANRRLATR